MKVPYVVVVALVGMFALAGVALQAEEMTLTGSVGDAMCGVKHAGPNAEMCTKGCVSKGSAFALIVDGKAYKLDTSSDEIKAQLTGLAGKTATVMGDVTGTDVKVASVKAG